MKRDISLLLILLIIILIWFKDVIFFNNIFCFGDIPRYYYPLREFAREQIRGGNIPLWNPFIFCGNPLLATLQSQVFYPLSIFTYILPMHKGFNIYTVMHIYLAGVFIYILLRSWKLSPSSCFISAIIYSLNSFIISTIHMNTTLSSVIWLPIILFFLDKALEKKSLFYAIITSIFLGVQFLGGEPTPLIYTVYIAFFYSIWRIWTSRAREKGFIKIIGLVLSIYIMAFSLVSVQAIPFIEFVRHTTKFSVSTLGNITMWSLHPKEFLNYIIPFTFGNITKPGETFGSQMWLVTNYMGLACLLLAGVTVFSKKDKRIKFWLVLLLMSILISLGKYTPVFSFIYKIFPLVKYNRYPVKYLFLTAFCMSIIAGFGWEKIIKRKIDKIMLTRTLLVVNTIFAVIVLIISFYWKAFFSFIVKSCFPAGIGKWQLERLSGVAVRDLTYLYQGMIFFSAISFFIIMWVNPVRKKSVSAGLFGVLFSVVLLLDLATADMEIVKVSPVKLFLSETENIRFIKRDSGLFRVSRSRVLDDFNNVVYGEDYAQGLQERKDTLTTNTIMLFYIYDAEGYDSVVREDVQNVHNVINTCKSLNDTKLPNMLNMKYLATMSPVKADGYKELIHKKFGVGEVYISKNRNVLPRVFLVDKYIVVKDRKEALVYISRKDFDPKKEVVLEAGPRTAYGAQRTAGSVGRGEYAEIISYKPGEIVVNAFVNQSKVLVFSESWYPGWKVYVDNNIGQLLRANYMLMGVFLDKGQHRVRFIYDPFSFKIGALVSVVALVVAIIILLFGFRKVKKSYK